MVLVITNLPGNTRDIRDVGLIPVSGISPRGRNGNPLQYPCLKNPMDREFWQVTVHGVAKSPTQLKRLSTHACNNTKLMCGDKSWVFIGRTDAEAETPILWPPHAKS